MKDRSHRRITLNDDIITRFRGALDLPTISFQAHDYRAEHLIKLIDHLEANFPLIHNSQFIDREIVSNYSLLFTVEGTEKHLQPYMLTSHLDVVPAVDEKWSSDPFKSVLKDDKHVYARGTIDAKHLVVSMLEALESMLHDGFKPKRSFYIVFGHDEEVGGVEGAQTVSKILPTKLRHNGWKKLEFVLDEGNIISRSPVLGISSPVALIGVVEKGYMTVKVSATGSVGHGSMPPQMTAITKLSKALSKFHSHLFPSFFGKGVEAEMIEIFARHSRWPYKLIYSNAWLFNPIFEQIFSSDPALNSLIRTSTAVTMVQGGTKENVLPDSASALINHRVHQLQTIKDVLDYDRQIINDPTIDIELKGHHNEPTFTSPYSDDSLGYQLIKRSVQEVYPDSIVVPSVFLAATDSKWYLNLTDSIYRFSAIAVHLEEMNRFHGHDERISLDNYENLINFYHHLIINSNNKDLEDIDAPSRDEL